MRLTTGSTLFTAIVCSSPVAPVKRPAPPTIRCVPRAASDVKETSCGLTRRTATASVASSQTTMMSGAWVSIAWWRPPGEPRSRGALRALVGPAGSSTASLRRPPGRVPRAGGRLAPRVQGRPRTLAPAGRRAARGARSSHRRAWQPPPTARSWRRRRSCWDWRGAEPWRMSEEIDAAPPLQEGDHRARIGGELTH